MAIGERKCLSDFINNMLCIQKERGNAKVHFYAKEKKILKSVSKIYGFSEPNL